ncbi:polysaccharide deacetylase [Oleiphilus messinensis]|uniref:Polysaccharide deacetylase n=1 Tax=Oleiphilus messinensis TaxID=141451 RepID=A0A1Y0I6R5_9GAMM|nr:polysaccharide deacetylase family protein [Oleiphilus messinensis]ARU56187.1 polysaccharide deacetylase [Oleiphilus messinensis]
MIRLIFKLLGNGKKLPILIYHQVLREADPMRPCEPTAIEFAQQMALLKNYFHPISLTDGLNQLRSGTLPKDAIAVTFDDGYENNYSVALPILKEHNVPATFFIASDFLDGGIMWNDAVIETMRRLPLGTHDLSDIGMDPITLETETDRSPCTESLLKALKHLPFDERAEKVNQFSGRVRLPTDLMMTSTQLKLLSESGMEIGGHTLSHPILTKLSESEAQTQIIENKHKIEAIIGKPITSFAYPNGKPFQDYDQSVREIVKQAGYSIAVTTSHGVAEAENNPFEFPRYTPWRKEFFGFLAQMGQNYFTKATFVS